MLPKQYRLQKDKDFKRVFLKGKFFGGRILSLKLIENSLELSRFGFIVGLKISKKATLRSQIKRKLRESIRAKLDRNSQNQSIEQTANTAAHFQG